MRRLLVIGIGAGDPDFVTVGAVAALNEVDVFLVLDKGPATADLTAARRAVCERFITHDRWRLVELSDPERDRRTPAYVRAVDDWRDERAALLEQALTEEVPDGGTAGFLVWGDPSLYDGTLRVIGTIARHGSLDLEWEVIPGITSVQALTARHRVLLNRVAGAVHLTTGRRLAQGLPDNADDVVVMLDADLACRAYADQDLDIYWGAYLGTEDEILVSGKLADVVDEIAEKRAAARARKGWIMDTYLLRRPGAEA
ncbi:precorrin-6A synthase (deacetylating) [Geodermatophilus marinus]|uniref:precorrin-6A synthase (deacetylating) n=1 Tax=Geodermatophilus sp. LHW52908 TaxID=2303986 RepID=UPI000E3BF226|nr:precorrin-6A synthase (deacetylating) [Geodermatophilus sp. LHW52908]RFU21730.1 precorrin-6A synthase (deacetylating) [Geodermatophilus sp. LHW52908]